MARAVLILRGEWGTALKTFFPTFLHQPQLTPFYTPTYHWSMVHNIADITPGSATVALKAVRTPCNWVKLSAPTGNAADIRVGDSTTGAASGLLLVKGTTITLDAISDTQYLDLSMVYVFGTTTDKVAVVYGTH